MLAGIDLGGTQVRVALARSDGRLIASFKTKTPLLRTPERMVEWAAEEIGRHRRREKVTSITIAAPSLVRDAVHPESDLFKAAASADDHAREVVEPARRSIGLLFFDSLTVLAADRFFMRGVVMRSSVLAAPQMLDMGAASAFD